MSDKSTATQRDPLYAAHVYVAPGDTDKRGCVKCGRLRHHPIHRPPIRGAA